MYVPVIPSIVSPSLILSAVNPINCAKSAWCIVCTTIVFDLNKLSRLTVLWTVISPVAGSCSYVVVDQFW